LAPVDWRAGVALPCRQRRGPHHPLRPRRGGPHQSAAADRAFHRIDRRKKVDSARATLARINPEISIEAIAERVAGLRLEQLVQSADVVIDATDNFATRHAVNRACVKFARPLVSGAGVRFDGQIAVFDLRRRDSPCYHCLSRKTATWRKCAARNGRVRAAGGVIGSMQAAEALKLLMGIGRDLTGRLLLLDALAMEWRSVRLKRIRSAPSAAAKIR